MTTYTPGPWTVGERCEYTRDTERLQEAAPELLAACEYASDTLNAAAAEKLITAPRWFQVQLGESAKLLDAAIAKARGGP